MLTVCTWKWRGTREYTSKQVNALSRAVKANLSLPHRFVCVTDDDQGLDDDIGVVPLPEFKHVKVKAGWPSCYVRLWAYEPAFAKTIGDRILMLDIDTAVVGDITPLVRRRAQWIGWRLSKDKQFQGAMTLMTAGARPQVWERFDAATAYKTTCEAGLVGSDQAWISHVLDKGEAAFTQDDGVWLHSRLIKEPTWPDNVRIVHFTGGDKPWKCASRLPLIHKEWHRYADMG